MVEDSREGCSPSSGTENCNIFGIVAFVIHGIVFFDTFFAKKAALPHFIKTFILHLIPPPPKVGEELDVDKFTTHCGGNTFTIFVFIVFAYDSCIFERNLFSVPLNRRLMFALCVKITNIHIIIEKSNR